MDPKGSLIVKASVGLLRLLQTWGDNDSPWNIVWWMGFLPAWKQDEGVRLFARKLIVQLSSGLFRRLEVR